MVVQWAELVQWCRQVLGESVMSLEDEELEDDELDAEELEVEELTGVVVAWCTRPSLGQWAGPGVVAEPVRP